MYVNESINDYMRSTPMGDRYDNFGKGFNKTAAIKNEIIHIDRVFLNKET